MRSPSACTKGRCPGGAQSERGVARVAAQHAASAPTHELKKPSPRPRLCVRIWARRASSCSSRASWERVANAHDLPDYERLRSILEELDGYGPLDWESIGGSALRRRRGGRARGRR